MAGRRRTQRSVRVAVATALVAGSAIVVVATLASSRLVGPAAVLGVILAAAAVRILASELSRTRFDAAVAHAEQAVSYCETLRQNRREQQAFNQTMLDSLHERDHRISALSGSLDLAERRASRAEALARTESQRADDAQGKLADLLDEVLGTAEYDVDADRNGDAAVELGRVVDLLGWESKLRA